MVLNISKRAWNNVIIFGVLIFFVLFYIAPSKMQQLQNDTHLLAPETPLIALRFTKTTLTKAGTQWRYQPGIAGAPDPLQLIDLWQQQKIELWTGAAPLVTALVCEVEVMQANQGVGQRWQFRIDQQQWYLQSGSVLAQLDAKTANALCPVVFRG